MKIIVGLILCAGALFVAFFPVVKTVGWRQFLAALGFAGAALGWLALVAFLLAAGANLIFY